MKKYILIILTLVFVNISYATTPEEHPDLKKLIDAAGKDTYLKDFPFELKPGEHIQFPIQLNKRTLYNWYANMKDYKQFRLTLYDNYGNTVYKTKAKTIGIFNFSTKSNKASKYILNIKNTSESNLSSTILLTSVRKLNKDETIVQNPKLEKILNASNDTYLKDFNINLDPNREARYSLVLSKNTIYSLSIYQNKPDQFELNLYDNKTRQLIKPKTLDINKQIHYNIYNISKTAVYEVIVKNKTPEPAESVALLAFIKKSINENTKNSEDDPELVYAEKNENYYFVVDDMPKFIGEIKDFKKYISKHLSYPQEALEKEIKGTVYIQFTVAKNGYIKDAKVARGVHPSLNQEALRVVYSSPKWEPGIKDGEPVDVVLTYPIIFKLP